MPIADSAFARHVKRKGLHAALRQACNAGIDFFDAYFMVFGRLPRINPETQAVVLRQP
jgi:hypothetical protein